MAIVLGMTGRFNSDVLIKESDVKSVISSRDRDHVGTFLDRVWDNIKDWFYGTHIKEAKKYLFDLYSDDLTDRQKAEVYFKLKNLCGNGYLDRFSENPTHAGFSVNINFGDKLLSYTNTLNIVNARYLSDELNNEVISAQDSSRIRGTNRSELARDLVRSRYSVSGEPLTDLAPEQPGLDGNLGNFKSAIVRKLSSTSEQWTAIQALAQQKTVGILMQSALEANGGTLRPEDTLHIRGDGDPSYDFARSESGRDIKFHARFASSWREEGLSEPRPCLLRVPFISVELSIAPSGDVTVNYANYASGYA